MSWSAESNTPDSEGKATLLVTSATSGVGAAVIDSLRGRRNSLRIIGISTDCSGNFPLEFDLFIESPATSSDAFLDFVSKLCFEQDIDLVIAGRDDDLVALAELNDNPESPVKLQSGPGHLLLTFRDKYLTIKWCEQRGIAVPDTVATSNSITSEVEQLVTRVGFPLIFKPRRGDGSRGVRILRDEAELSKALEFKNHVIQAYIGPVPSVVPVPELELGVPLFWNLPLPTQSTIVFVIDSNRNTGEFFFHRTNFVAGVPRQLWWEPDPELEAFGEMIMKTLISSGFNGTCNFSVMRGLDGIWRVIEVNARFGGSTACRTRLGFDVVAKTLNLKLGREVLTPLTEGFSTNLQINRQVRDIFVFPSEGK